jgi:hypothetical protein
MSYPFVWRGAAVAAHVRLRGAVDPNEDRFVDLFNGSC